MHRKGFYARLLVCACAAAAATTAPAATKTWDGTNNSYKSAHWSGTLPAVGDTLNLNSGTASLTGSSQFLDINDASSDGLTLNVANTGKLVLTDVDMFKIGGANSFPNGPVRTGTLNVSNGGSVSYDFTDFREEGCYVGFGTGSTGFVTVTGAGSTFSSPTSESLSLGRQGGSGSLTISNNGEVSVGALLLGSGTANASSGGKLVTGSAFVGTSNSDSGSLTLIGPSTTWTAGGFVEIGGAFFATNGVGTVLVSNDAQLNASSNLNIRGGVGTMLTIDGGSVSASSVNNQAMLKLLDGQLTAPVTNSGTLALEGSGSRAIDGNVTFAAGGRMSANLSSADPLDPMLEIDGDFSLALTDFLDLSGGAAGEEYLLATYTGVLTGQFDQVTSNYLVTYHTAQKQIVVTAVPEPAGMLVAGSMVGVAALRRRRRNRSVC